MDTFEIKDEEINVEDIMRQIRENIRKRRESGAYTKEMEVLYCRKNGLDMLRAEALSISDPVDYIREVNENARYRSNG